MIIDLLIHLFPVLGYIGVLSFDLLELLFSQLYCVGYKYDLLVPMFVSFVKY